MLKRIASALLVMLLIAAPAAAQTPAAPAASAPADTIVAAENFYADIATQIAGPDVPVSAILSNPDEDPHLFEASPSVARRLSTASIAIRNGAEYDPWIGKLLAATPRPGRIVITAAALVHAKPGANPHLWYDPATMRAVAQALAGALQARHPAEREAIAARLQRFLQSLQPLEAKIAAMRARYAGTPVTATESVAGYLADAIGLTMRNQRFQWAVMNNTEPGAAETEAFEHDLRSRAVRVLIYNRQATDSAAQRLLRIAQQSGVPIVGVTETEPADTRYQDWMLSTLTALDRALSGR